MLNISTAFPNSSESLLEFFKRSGIGYYIPLYQRQYSWDKENIDQMMEDICNGVKELLSSNDAIRFMGTIILFEEKNKDINIKPQDRRALPPRIDNVIDGQQRISTIALLATQLYQRLYNLKQKFKKSKEDTYIELIKDFDSKMLDLIEMFSVDLRRGTPERKPIIIRGSIDQWSLDGSIPDNYKSDISNFLASFIEAINENKPFPKINNNNLVNKNLKVINTWLNKVEKAHEASDNIFPTASDIVNKIDESYIWSYERLEYSEKIKQTKYNVTSISNTEKHLLMTVQLFIFVHYLCKRACFTLIEPIQENWAFDMFQSLNASGSPLTAIETFKPLVVNDFNISENNRFKGNDVEKYFDKVEKLLDESTANKKDKITNEFLTTLALCHDGNKNGMSTQFSSQRAWLNMSYNSIGDKKEFIYRMHNLATFWENVIHFKPHLNLSIDNLYNLSDEDKKIASLNCLYLRDANHKMAYTILNRFYSMVIREKQNSDHEFLEATKAIVAFFTLWRSSYSNTGLDDVYRKILRNNDKESYKGLSWSGDYDNLNSKYLKDKLRNILIQQKNIKNFDSWFKNAKNNFRFDIANKVCRFALLIVSSDTIPDEINPGLMKIGKSGLHNYLTANHWIDDELKTVEHVAPQQYDSSTDWDQSIYDNDCFHLIGNLTLLPVDINSSIGNKDWKIKLIYYKHLAEKDPKNIESLIKQSKDLGIELNTKTIELLKNTKYKHHLEPIINNMDSEKNSWTLNLIEKRTERICEITWNKLSSWLDYPKESE